MAQCFFIGTVAIAFGRTKDSAAGPNPPTFINIEAHSIAFSALYFWIIPVVCIASIIGVSQTQDAIPRILRRLSKEVKKEFPHWDTVPLSEQLITPDGRDEPNTELRERSGGIYSWRPHEAREVVKANLRRQPLDISTDVSTFWRRIRYLLTKLIILQPGSQTLPLIVITYGCLTGMLISYLVPPAGWDCRHLGEFPIYAAWVVSSVIDHIPFCANNPKLRFRLIVLKDILFTIATMGGIVVTQVGIFNRCSCYTRWGRVGLALPENALVSNTLFWRINTAYPAIAFLCVGFQLVVVPILIIRQYELAVRVFLQRDDETSNLSWMDGIRDFPRNLARLWRTLARKCGELKTEIQRVSMLVWTKNPRRGEYEIAELPLVPETAGPSNNKLDETEVGQQEMVEDIGDGRLG